MFEKLIAKQKAEHLDQTAGQYTEGVKLYTAFQQALKNQDTVRTPKLAVKLDSWYDSLTQPQRHDFCAILVKDGLVTGTLAEAIKVLSGVMVKITE